MRPILESSLESFGNETMEAEGQNSVHPVRSVRQVHKPVVDVEMPFESAERTGQDSSVIRRGGCSGKGSSCRSSGRSGKSGEVDSSVVSRSVGRSKGGCACGRSGCGERGAQPAESAARTSVRRSIGLLVTSYPSSPIVCLSMAFSCSRTLFVAFGALLLSGCGDKPAEGRASPSDRGPRVEPLAVRRPLFASDVDLEVLPLSVAIETLGGVSTVMIRSGVALPVEHREVFSTASDNQSAVDVHIALGERTMVVDNHSLGRFHFVGIPPAPRGVPQIEVLFAVDATGALEVTARDLGTGKAQQVTFSDASSTVLSKEAVEALMVETLATEIQDADHHRWVTARNRLDELIYKSQELLDSSSDRLPEDVGRRCEEELATARSVLLLHFEPGDTDVLIAAHESLQSAVHAATGALYGNQ